MQVLCFGLFIESMRHVAKLNGFDLIIPRSEVNMVFIIVEAKRCDIAQRANIWVG
jgi:hypothetical protein